MDILGLAYMDFAEIREAISERRQNAWLDLAGNSTQSLEALEALQLEMFADMNDRIIPNPDRPECESHHLIRRCNRILKAIQDAEDEFQSEIELRSAIKGSI